MKDGLISDNGISRVWREGDWVYKRQPKFLCENEWWCLKQMYPTGYVPYAERVDFETIRMEDLGQGETVTSPLEFMACLPKVLNALMTNNIRHGDLTEYAVIVKDNKPYLIDFAESRLWNDPRPDKRPRGDSYWLTHTMRKLACVNTRMPEMWKLVEADIDFKGKSVLDLGCGHGDALVLATLAGASNVHGVDNDTAIIEILSERMDAAVHITYDDILHFLGRCPIYDIIVCFSVLPYLPNILEALVAIRACCRIALIECQYAGDGPGPDALQDDDDMHQLLLGAGFSQAVSLGYTEIADRDARRTIWRCE